MSGHIKLGPADDIRPLLLLSPNNYQATPANPFAARISTSNTYGDLDAYSEWVTTDWRAGTGKRDPETGMLFSHLDTRFPNQAILPIGWTYPVTTKNVHTGDSYEASDVSVAVGSKAAVAFTYTGTTTDAGGAWVYVDAADGTLVTVEIYSSSGGSPSASVSSGTATVDKLRPGPIWLYVQTTSYTATNGATYHIAISGTAALTAPAVQGVAHAYNGSAWATSTYGFAALLSVVRASSLLALQAALTDLVLMQNGDGITLGANAVISHLAVVRGNVYMAYANELYKIDPPAATSIGTTSSRITSMIAAGDELWIGYGSGHAVYVPATGVLTDNTGTPADLLHLFGGYMWRATGSTLYYSADGSTWTSVGAVGGWDTQIRGMAGMERDLYCATDDGLYMVAPGDTVVQVSVWPTRSELNGAAMVNWENSLYIALAEDVVRFDQSGGLQQIGLRTGEELPSDVQGTVAHLRATNYFLLASVAPADASGYGSLWAYNGQGWHCIGLAPQGVAGGDIAIDNVDGYIWWGQDFGLAARSNYPSSVVNPVRDDAAMRFARYGWLEFDRFYGGFVGLEKDLESVYCDTEEMDSARMYVYWQDDDSTDWELLGSSTTDDFELRWSDYDTRPATKWMRLGLLLRTDDETLTPILRAHRLKFHSMITDRWRWQLTLGVHDYQEMLDGTVGEYTAAELKAHIESCIQSVPPVIFEDVDGTQYEVKVVGAARTMQQFEYLPDGPKLQYVYALTLEQVTADVYAV